MPRAIDFNTACENLLATIENAVRFAAERPEYASELAQSMLDASRDLQRDVDNLPLIEVAA